MNVGETIELAIWLNGEETTDQLEQFARDCQHAILTASQENGVTCAPIRWVIRYPGEQRVPPVPDHIHGAHVRLLIAEAEIVKAGFIIVPENQAPPVVH